MTTKATPAETAELKMCDRVDCLPCSLPGAMWHYVATVTPSAPLFDVATKPKAAPLDDVGNDSGDSQKNEVK